jgi:16S rRNA (guanine966-N2)-methyltransferase
MRIISGKHRGRQLSAPEGWSIRPTADRTRESLFNLLEHGRLAAEGSRVAGATVLDAFAGTGSFCLEALSRGAAIATAMDNDRKAIASIRANAEALGEAGSVILSQADALRPPPATTQASLVFLDPPYAKDMAIPALEALSTAGWIAAKALIAIETGSKESLEAPPGFTLEDARRYGRAKVWLLLRS